LKDFNQSTVSKANPVYSAAYAEQLVHFRLLPSSLAGAGYLATCQYSYTSPSNYQYTNY
jgi:hypothetical protein